VKLWLIYYDFVDHGVIAKDRKWLHIYVNFTEV